MKHTLVGLFFLYFNSLGQIIPITGTVSDKNNQSIELATIDIVGININATTDSQGLFYKPLPKTIKKGDYITLRISKEGYKTETKHIIIPCLPIIIKLTKLNIPKGKDSPKVADKNPVIIQQTPISPPINVTSNNQNGGITAAQVNIGAVPRKLDLNVSNQLLTSLPNKDEKIEITSIMGDSESFRFATEISKFLKDNGYKNVDGVNQAVYSQPVIGQFFNRDAKGVKILIGAKP